MCLATPVAAVGDPSVGAGFPIPGGGSLDIWPILQDPLTWIVVLGDDGRADWPLGTVGSSSVGLTFELQMTTFDPVEGVFDVKSGVSTLTVAP